MQVLFYTASQGSNQQPFSTRRHPGSPEPQPPMTDKRMANSNHMCHASVFGPLFNNTSHITWKYSSHLHISRNLNSSLCLFVFTNISCQYLDVIQNSWFKDYTMQWHEFKNLKCTGTVAANIQQQY